MTDKDFYEGCISSEQIFDGKVLDVRKDRVSLPDGRTATREYCRHIGAVCVVPLTDDNEIIFVRQYRYAQGRVMLEIPAGKLDSANEDHEEATRRELKEETGAECKELIYLGKMFPSPALLGEVIHMFFARGLILGESNPDEDEFIECERIPLKKLVDMACNNELFDAKTQIAALRVWKMLNE